MRAATWLPWSVAGVSAAVAVYLGVSSPDPAPSTAPEVAQEVVPTSTITGPDPGPPPPETLPPPPAAVKEAPPVAAELPPEPAPAPPRRAQPTGLRYSHGPISMVELTDPKTGERYFRVVSRPVEPAQGEEATQEAPEGDAGSEEAEQAAEGEQDLIPVEPETTAPEEPALTSDDIRRIVREEMQAQEAERIEQTHAEIEAERKAIFDKFVKDTDLLQSDAKELSSLLQSEVDYIEQTRERVTKGELRIWDAWMKLDQRRGETERKLRALLGDRGYALFHQRGLGYAMTGLGSMEIGNMQPNTAYR